MPVEVVPGLQDPPRPKETSAPAASETAPQAKKAGSWVGHVLRPLNSRASSKTAAPDPLLAFASELEQPKTSSSAPPQKKRSQSLSAAARMWKMDSRLVLSVAIIATGIVLTAAVTFGLTRVSWSRGAAAAVPTGRLTVVTRPAGAVLTVDGADHGVTPLAMSLDAGDHVVTVRLGQAERVIPVTVGAGSDIVQDLEMTPAVPREVFGQLSIGTDPPGASVTVDGQSSGTSPLTVEHLTVGEHLIAVASATGSAERRVTITAGQAASVLFSLPKAAGPIGGWLSVSAPFDLQVVEHDEVIASGSAKIMVAAGRHDIVLTNPALGYQESRRVEVTAGQTTAIRIDAPVVTINVNARPWADVAIDGTDLGQTPISNASVSVGSHQMVFRHPQFGERRETVLVTVKGPNRVAVDLTK